MSLEYNIFMHKIGQRVIEERSGKHGAVVEIRETAAEWIEPIVKFDDEEKPRKVHGTLWLEPIKVPHV